MRKVEWLYRILDEETDERFGKEPSKRTLEELKDTGIINVDKHIGPTSHLISEDVKKILNLKKTGHIGTLDPNASGVLPVLLNKSTRLAPLFQKLDKEYVGVMHLHKDIDESFLKEFIETKFIGKIKQTPPKRSAVARVLRERYVYEAYLLEKDGKDVLFKIICESGFYVRKYVHDIGQKLKIGAHLKELRRVSIGKYNLEEKTYYKIFDEENSISLFDLMKMLNSEEELRKIIKPAEYYLTHVKKVFVKDTAIHNITLGAPLYVSGITRVQSDIRKNDLVAIFSLKNELVAFGVAVMDSVDMINSKEGIAVKIDRVFIDKNVYPRIGEINKT
ncbi:MAG: RNA-guided pseudouridylation complex pseudouridine synthase subunit Cbf5 [Candidatus Aenigmatarchaeota archaeon]